MLVPAAGFAIEVTRSDAVCLGVLSFYNAQRRVKVEQEFFMVHSRWAVCTADNDRFTTDRDDPYPELLIVVVCGL